MTGLNSYEKFFVDAVKALGRRWEKCMALEGTM